MEKAFDGTNVSLKGKTIIYKFTETKSFIGFYYKIHGSFIKNLISYKLFKLLRTDIAHFTFVSMTASDLHRWKKTMFNLDHNYIEINRKYKQRKVVRFPALFIRLHFLDDFDEIRKEMPVVLIKYFLMMSIGEVGLTDWLVPSMRS